MTRSRRLLAPVLLAAVSGCADKTATTRANPDAHQTTRPAESTNNPVPFQRLVLYDVHDLNGGTLAYLSHDGTLWLQIVDRPQPGQSGMQEKRCKVLLNPAQITALETLLGKHQFRDIQIQDHPGIPDDAHPAIELTTPNGTIIKKGKWAEDRNEDFDPIYHALQALATVPPNQPPIYTGQFDYHWRPHGFGKP